MAKGWVQTGQKADLPFGAGFADRLGSASAAPDEVRRDSGVTGLMDAVDSGRFSGKKGAKRLRRQIMPALVKGYGVTRPNNQPLSFRTPLEDHDSVDRMAEYSAKTLGAVIDKGLRHPELAIKGFSKPLRQQMRALNLASPQGVTGSLMAQRWSKQIGDAIGKSFSLASPLSSGFVPFDLMPFVRTIYPVYTPLRNKIPRPPGQGEYHRGKILASISGALPGGMGTIQDDSTSEFFGGSGFSQWPNPLPASGSQSAYDISIPYKFYALTESVSWLAQFMGQGFDDLYGLASLVLLQEFMLLEERDIIASTSQALSTPSTPTLAARTAGSNETALSGVTTNVYVKVAAINYWGQTIGSTGASVAWSSGQVVDVTIPSVPGAQGYVLYTTTGASAGTYYQFTTNTIGGVVGGVKFTLQGALPTSGASPATADTGTYSANRAESLISVMSGHAYNGGSGPYPNVAAGYYNGAAASLLNVALVQSTLQQMFNGTNGYLANPSEILTSPNDATILAQSIQSESVAAYQLRVQQSEMAGVTAGIAVANVVNPVTRSAPEIVIHPYLNQGTAMFMSYTLPQTQNNLGNVVEQVMVQDYAQIGWPVIDPAFRQSILRVGTFFMPAPQYCGLLQGLQQSATTPYS